ncbi:carbohydrate ABC transporter permease [Actinorugispora endophytica]|uniref:Carbohydrate ABC transporter membrane protein 2 (CUT1 family) n=1 Tax=Actinorugispora endophytica TaxID=1605990 RepID=A0A4R6UXB5_9ACTN|nr:carbohydrate ABC transporter permease [Actinorugispora endophytica]TDQ52029.1 carbohydrate ABC transporter membrane protein 2 (CUT1 family) [Actinorugispora endophytica]
MAATTTPRAGARTGPARRAPRIRVTPGSAVLYAVAAACALLWLAPLLWAVATSVKPEAETTAVPVRWLTDNPTTQAYASVLARGDLLRWMANSAIISVLVTALTLVLCVLAAYGFAKCRFPGRGWLFAVVVAGILVPPQVLIVPLFAQMGLMGLVDTYWGIALPQVVAPVMVFVLKRFFDGIPAAYEDAARMDGAGPLRVLWSVVLPMSRPVLAAVGIFTFVGAWNNFLWPFVATTDPAMMTLPVGLGTVQGAYGLQYAQTMAAAVISALPLLVVFLFFQRQIVSGIAGVGIKG